MNAGAQIERIKEKRVKIKSISRYGLLLSMALAATMGQAVTINFDDGQPNDTAIGGYYAGLGVTFSNANWGSNFGLAGSSGSQWVYHSTDYYQPQQSNPITAVFAVGQSTVTLRGVDVGFNGYRIRAFDATSGGSQVDTDVVFGTTDWGVGEYYDLTVTGPGNIRRIEFSQDTNVGGGDGMGFDDLVYDAVPEPGTFAVFGAALLMLAKKRRK